MLPQEKTKQKDCVTKTSHEKVRKLQGKRGSHQSKQERGKNFKKPKENFQQDSTKTVGLVVPRMPAQRAPLHMTHINCG